MRTAIAALLLAATVSAAAGAGASPSWNPVNELAPENVVDISLSPTATVLQNGTVITVGLRNGLSAQPVTYACTNLGLAYFAASALPRMDLQDPTPRSNLERALWQVHFANADLSATGGVVTVVFPGATSDVPREPGFLWAYYEDCGNPDESSANFYSYARSLVGPRPGMNALAQAATPVFVTACPCS